MDNETGQTILLSVFTLGTLCFLFQVMRQMGGRPRKRLWQDTVTIIGSYLSPFFWVYGVVYMMACYADHLEGHKRRGPRELPIDAKELMRKIVENEHDTRSPRP